MYENYPPESGFRRWSDQSRTGVIDEDQVQFLHFHDHLSDQYSVEWSTARRPLHLAALAKSPVPASAILRLETGSRLLKFGKHRSFRRKPQQSLVAMGSSAHLPATLGSPCHDVRDYIAYDLTDNSMSKNRKTELPMMETLSDDNSERAPTHVRRQERANHPRPMFQQRYQGIAYQKMESDDDGGDDDDGSRSCGQQEDDPSASQEVSSLDSSPTYRTMDDWSFIDHSLVSMHDHLSKIVAETAVATGTDHLLCATRGGTAKPRRPAEIELRHSRRRLEPGEVPAATDRQPFTDAPTSNDNATPAPFAEVTEPSSRLPSATALPAGHQFAGRRRFSILRRSGTKSQLGSTGQVGRAPINNLNALSPQNQADKDLVDALSPLPPSLGADHRHPSVEVDFDLSARLDTIRTSAAFDGRFDPPVPRSHGNQSRPIRATQPPTTQIHDQAPAVSVCGLLGKTVPQIDATDTSPDSTAAEDTNTSTEDSSIQREYDGHKYGENETEGSIGSKFAASGTVIRVPLPAPERTRRWNMRWVSAFLNSNSGMLLQVTRASMSTTGPTSTDSPEQSQLTSNPSCETAVSEGPSHEVFLGQGNSGMVDDYRLLAQFNRNEDESDDILAGTVYEQIPGEEMLSLLENRKDLLGEAKRRNCSTSFVDLLRGPSPSKFLEDFRPKDNEMEYIASASPSVGLSQQPYGSHVESLSRAFEQADLPLDSEIRLRVDDASEPRVLADMEGQQRHGQTHANQTQRTGSDIDAIVAESDAKQRICERSVPALPLHALTPTALPLQPHPENRRVTSKRISFAREAELLDGSPRASLPTVQRRSSILRNHLTKRSNPSFSSFDSRHGLDINDSPRRYVHGAEETFQSNDGNGETILMIRMHRTPTDFSEI
jgi:hypothetical protein